MTTNDRGTVRGGVRSAAGYWPLESGPGIVPVHRIELAPAPADRGGPVLTVVHLSDLHVCDAQSPARGEFLDRWADPDSPLKPVIDEIGSYRPQEMLTSQVADAMVRAANAVTAGPVGGAPVDWAITTGDVVDSAQANELAWYLGLLDGGQVTPDSGSPKEYEGVADRTQEDPWFWHPEPGPPDRPRLLHGFPDAPGLLDQARRPIRTTGLRMPWLAVHGNHDQLIQGTFPPTDGFPDAGAATSKAIGVPPSWTPAQVAAFCQQVDGNGALDRWGELVMREITADPLRTIITRQQFLAAHLHPAARPTGHGFPADAGSTGRAYYRYDHLSNDHLSNRAAPTVLTVLVLDTVNEFGGWQGCLDAGQLAWLKAELTAADRDGRHVILASHHTLADLVNDTTGPGAERRVLAAELAGLLDRHRCLVLWLNGHTHVTAVLPHRTSPSSSSGLHGWWEVTAPSLIDFPQQGRVVEVIRGRGTLTIAATMLDHAGELPWSGRVDSVDAMAGLSRQLAANDWQWEVDDLDRHRRAGQPDDRNVLLHLRDPFPAG